MITLDRATVFPPSPATPRDPILRDVTLAVRAGLWIALVGRNGAGKSTLLAALASLRPLDRGTIAFHDGVRPNVAMLLQEPDNQLVASSVYRELEFSLPAQTDEPHAAIVEATRRFGLEGTWRRNPHRLSGGEKQRLALATVWLQRPDVVLLDEPTAFLDPPSTRRCVAFVEEMHAAGASVVWAGPGEDDVERADTVVCLEDGAITFQGDTAAWRRWPGRDDFAFSPPPPPQGGVAGAGDAVAVFEGVSFDYGSGPVLSGVDLSVRSGECLGVTGSNGAGKSTLLLLAGGALAPTAGQVTGGGGAVFYLPQSPERMFFAETVEEEVAFGLRRRGVSKDEARRRAHAALEDVGLAPARIARRQPFDLSFGEMRRVAFAVASVLEPALLLLDEPTACLDPRGVGLFYDLIERERSRGTAVVVASHDPRAVSVCDRVIELDNATPG